MAHKMMTGISGTALGVTAMATGHVPVALSAVALMASAKGLNAAAPALLRVAANPQAYGLVGKGLEGLRSGDAAAMTNIYRGFYIAYKGYKAKESFAKAKRFENLAKKAEASPR
jgi:hypothetical protein